MANKLSFTLDKVVPWGRSFVEYTAMFSLIKDDLAKRILGCSDGPSSFNTELTQQGGSIISVDPIYQFSSEEIKERVDATYDEVMGQIEKNRNDFVWKHIENVEELGNIRMKAMQKFLVDYPVGFAENRYIQGELPALSFQDNEFDVALCSHFLFLYSEHFSFDFHIQSLMELCRVAPEVRIFPLLDLSSKKSKYLSGVITHLEENGYDCRIKKVSYEFQRDGDEMLQVKSGKNK